jgi:hypothetical protein
LDKFLDVFFELAAGQENAPATSQTSQADIRTQADDLPLVATTGVLLPQPYNVVHPNFNHDRYPISLLARRRIVL